MGVIRINNLTYALNSKYILRNFSLSLEMGEILGFFSMRGSGKSILFNLLISNNPMINEKVFLNDKPLDYKSRKSFFHLINGIGDLIHSMTVLENIAIVSNFKKRKIINKNKIERSLKILLEKYEIQLNINKKIHELNNTDKILILLLRGLYNNKKIFLIDDGVFEHQFLINYSVIDTLIKKLQEEGIAFMVASYSLENLSKLTKVIVYMENGMIVQKMTISESHEIFKPKENVVKSIKHKSEPLATIVLNKENDTVNLYRGHIIVLHDNKLSNNINVYNNLIIANDTNTLFYNQTLSRKKVVFKDFRADKMMFKNLSLFDNLIFPIYPKVSKFGFIRPSTKKIVENEFFNYTGESILSSKINYYSLSEKQKLQIYFYQILIMNPKLLICYSPDVYSDLNLIEYIYEQLSVLSSKGISIVVIATKISNINENLVDIVYLENGRKK